MNTPEQRELSIAMLKIFPTMKSPFSSRDKRRKTLCKAIDKLSEKTFDLYLEQVLEVVNMKYEVSSEFENTEAQVDGIIKWLPRMAAQRERLAEYVKIKRAECGLQI